MLGKKKEIIGLRIDTSKKGPLKETPEQQKQRQKREYINNLNSGVYGLSTPAATSPSMSSSSGTQPLSTADPYHQGGGRQENGMNSIIDQQHNMRGNIIDGVGGDVDDDDDEEHDRITMASSSSSSPYDQQQQHHHQQMMYQQQQQQQQQQQAHNYHMYQMQQQQQQQQQQLMDQNMYNDDSILMDTNTPSGNNPAGGYIEDEDEPDEPDEPDELDEDYESSSSLPEAEEDIDYDVVYALHTFLATVEGQASVVKGDQLTLLDDSNSYWWLVRVLKTQLVGYIPAENIETPEERLARFYKKQNLNHTKARDTDIAHGAASARRARNHFQQPHHPSNRMLQESFNRPKVQLNRELQGGGRFVDFGPPSFQEFVGYEYSDEDTDASMEEGDGYEDEGGENAGGDFDDEEEEEEDGEEEEGEEGSEGSFEGANMEDDGHTHHMGTRQQILNHRQQQHAHLEGVTGGPANHNKHGYRRGNIEEDQHQDADEDITQQYSMRSPEEYTGIHDNNHQAQNDTIMYTSKGASNSALTVDGASAMEVASTASTAQAPSRMNQAKAQAALGVANGNRPAQFAIPNNTSMMVEGQERIAPTALNRNLSIDEQLRAERDSANTVQMAQPTPRIQTGSSEGYSSGTTVIKQKSPTGSTSSTSSNRLKAFGENATGNGSSIASQDNETRKISLTPKIAREDSVDSNLSDVAGPVTGSQTHQHQHNRLQPPQGHHQQLQKQSNRSASNASSAFAGDTSMASSTLTGGGGRITPIQSADSEDQSHFRRGSAGSASSSVGSSMSGTSSAQKRGSSPATSEATSASSNASKKKKSGGILGGLFSRNKKDKKDEKDKKIGARRVSGSTSDDDRGSGTSSPAPESPESQKSNSSPIAGPDTQQLQQRRAVQQVKEDMFGNEAARRQQQVEAQTVMYQNYGINPRGPGDTTNTSTFASTSAPPPPAIVQSPPTSIAPADNTVSAGIVHPLHHHTVMVASPSSSSMQSSLSASLGPTGQRLRPGSLIGSPHMSGPSGSGEVPVLNVLRVFAGDNIVSNATFKTVLLNDGTSTEDLVKQAMQRFRLDPPIPKDPRVSAMDAILEEYYLTAKELDGEETRLQPGQRPLKLVESLSHASGYLQPGQGLPSVKRSSVGSISSISSTLSMNPAIERLRMSDFSDDSHVKLFINRRTSKLGDSSKRASDSSSIATITGKGIGDDLILDASRLSGTSYMDKIQGNSPQSPLLRFAVKLVIQPQDLPESMAFDPYSNALIAKTALPERAQQASRNHGSSSTLPPPTHREKILFFPRNANVSEMLESALDRFGIVEGVVDGGDDVDNKAVKRRSMSRIKYCLAASVSRSSGGTEETILGPSTKVVEAYSQPPAFRAYERSSKEFRRRSMESPYNAPSAADLQPSDPVFIIRKAIRNNVASGLVSALKTIEDVPLQTSLVPPDRSGSRASNITSSGSVYATPTAEIPPSLERALSPQQAKQEIIAAQRAASRATQRAMISAHKNERQGVDVVLADKSTIRSSREGSNMRYSYIAADGTSEVDISEIVEHEWRSDSRLDSREGSITPIPPRDSPSAMSHMTAESYTSALTSPLTPAISLPGQASTRTASAEHEDDDDAEERVAIERVAATPLVLNVKPKDHLEQALGTKRAGHSSSAAVTPDSASEILDDRLDRVLAKVRSGSIGATSSGMASALRSQQQQQGRMQGNSDTSKDVQPVVVSKESGRSKSTTVTRADSATSDRGPSYVSQMMRARSGSATSSSSAGRSSPGPQALEKMISTSARSTPQPEAPPSSGSSTPRRVLSKGHVKQSSIASRASDSSSARSASPSTPATISAGNTTLTPVSSTRNDSSTSHRLAIPYREDLGLEYLMQLVHSESETVKLPPVKKPDIIDILQGQYDWPSLSPEIAAIYERPKQQLDDLDRRLDLLLEQVLTTSNA